MEFLKYNINIISKYYYSQNRTIKKGDKNELVFVGLGL